MTSTSSGGSSRSSSCSSRSISNIDVAEQEVQAAINAGPKLAAAPICRTPPIYSKINPADAPVLTLALTSNTMPLPKVEDLADTRLAQKISQIAGRGPGEHQRRAEAGCSHSGQPDGARVVRLDLEDLRTRCRRPNVNQAKGNFDGPRQSYHHRRQRSAPHEQRITAPIVIAYRNGAPVLLSDVANVVDGAENIKQAAWMNDAPGGHRQHSAAARREHHQSGRPHQDAAAATAERRCRPRSRLPCSPTAPRPSARRWRTCSSS